MIATIEASGRSRSFDSVRFTPVAQDDIAYSGCREAYPGPLIELFFGLFFRFKDRS
jgi:hypothetical protein